MNELNANSKTPKSETAFWRLAPSCRCRLAGLQAICGGALANGMLASEFLHRDARSAAERARAAARQTERFFHIFEALLRIMQRPGMLALRRHQQRCRYLFALQRLADAVVAARALRRWAEHRRRRVKRLRTLVRAAAVSPRIRRGAAFRGWARRAERACRREDAIDAALRRVCSLAFGRWRTTTRLELRYVAVTQRALRRGSQARFRRAWRPWAGDAHAAFAADRHALALRGRTRLLSLRASLRRWRAVYIGSSAPVLREALLWCTWVEWHRATSARRRTADAESSLAATRAAARLHAWSARARADRRRGALAAFACRGRTLEQYTSAMAALRFAVMRRAAGHIGDRRLLALGIAVWRCRAFDLAFRPSGARSAAKEAVVAGVRGRLLMAVLLVWRAHAWRTAHAARFDAGVRARWAGGARALAFSRWLYLYIYIYMCMDVGLVCGRAVL